MLSWHKSKGEAFVTAGVGHGKTDLAAFDNAELDAGIIDVNAMPVTSFIPCGWKIYSDKEKLKKKTGGARFIPMTFEYSTSKTSPVSAAIAIGVPSKKSMPCIIMKYSSTEYNQVELERLAIRAVEEVFETRDLSLGDIISRSIENHPKKGLFASALAAVLFFPGKD